jgi:sulfoxide reductase catalytic subunit YedY
MAFVHRRPGWKLADQCATPEAHYLNRRRFLAAMGLGAIGAAVFSTSNVLADAAKPESLPASMYGPEPLPKSRYDLFPAKRNDTYKLDRELTDEKVANHYNNFYEFGTNKTAVARRAVNFKTAPWTIEIAGLVKKPMTLDFDDLVKKMPIEERLYRHRCVEAWSMAVPWTGFPFKALIDLCEPRSDAKFVRLISASKPDEMPGIKEQNWYPWPYFEGISMAEATNELALMCVGVYGHPLPNSHGAPLRLAMPWKYGYKSPKAIVKLEFVEKEPETFWHKLAPTEYSFLSNVDPTKPHPRWSQARETIIGIDKKVDTLPFNGYGEYVAKLYA